MIKVGDRIRIIGKRNTIAEDYGWRPDLDGVIGKTFNVSEVLCGGQCVHVKSKTHGNGYGNIVFSVKDCEIANGKYFGYEIEELE